LISGASAIAVDFETNPLACIPKGSAADGAACVTCFIHIVEKFHQNPDGFLAPQSANHLRSKQIGGKPVIGTLSAGS
jgi:hypothetical protein